MRPAGRSFRSVFQSPLGSQLRAVTIDGAPWFLAKDVCNALGIADTNNIRRGMAPDEVESFKVKEMRGRPPLILNEAGLYRLTMRSNKPAARPFQDWVVKDVLPALRKDGRSNQWSPWVYRTAPRSRLARGRAPVCQGKPPVRLAWDIPAGR
ncbi:BRO-N domain-containing protein [Pseudaquabacterium rugosum]|uniref:BRO-N domain-containing protein n=1 Tax=Pseudaquabacterium rugosum TaxID=2984194 RepID=UPI003BF9F583